MNMEYFFPVLASLASLLFTGLATELGILLGKKIKESEANAEAARIAKTVGKLQANATSWNQAQADVKTAVDSAEQQYLTQVKNGIAVPIDRKEYACNFCMQLLALHGIPLTLLVVGPMIEAAVLQLPNCNQPTTPSP
jgi:hypothetical protein